MTPGDLVAARDRIETARDQAQAAGDTQAATTLTAALFAQLILGHLDGVDLTRYGRGPQPPDGTTV